MDSLPSPALSADNSPRSSPSAPLNIGRKRARSAESEASSSKRAMSEDPSLCSVTDPPQSVASPHSKTGDEDEDDEINSYMREQDAQGDERVEFETSTSSQYRAPQPPAEKLQLIETLKKQPMIPGETWYIVSRPWYRRWEKACSGEVDKEGAVLESQVGAVDNSAFFRDGEFESSHPMEEGIDIELVPAVAWKAFIEWYGETPLAIPRQVITRGLSKEVTLELHPLCLPIYRLVSDSFSPTENLSKRRLTISSQAQLAELRSKLLNTLELPLQTFRVWVIERGDKNEASISVSRLQNDGGRLLSSDNDADTLEESLIQSDVGLLVEVPENGSWLVDTATVNASGSANMDSTAPIFSSGSDFFSKMGSSSSKKPDHSASQNVALKSTSASSSSSYGKGKADKKGVIPGTIGFTNMGNTCFMNSALQCLAHTKELVEYFLTGIFQEELNPDNPLGMQGAIAEAFGALLNRVWLPQTSASYAPREFKMQLQRFAPQFSGYQQHDSQELVAFLLDGLHEDLNRVLKKPYVEKPDWEGGGDKELVTLAKESWEGYMKRNDSVIVDLFQGQYMSTLICPECKKVSITFDPFMYLTLPLPLQKKWTHSILYIPWDSAKPHVTVPVEVNRNASFREVRQLLGRWMNTEPDNLLTLETFNNRFYKYLDDTSSVSDMLPSDHIVCFELPCHAQQSRTWRPDPDPNKDPIILPVHLCKEIPSSHDNFQKPPPNGFAHPFVVVLNNEEVRDRSKIYAAVIDRLARWTIHARDLYHWEADHVIGEETIPEKGLVNSVTEIKENGDIITVEEVPEEGDIVDEKSTVLEDDLAINVSENKLLRLGPKPDLFETYIQSGHEKLVTGNAWSGTKWEQWEKRKAVGDGENPALLVTDDALYCEWDDNFRTYFFGEEPQFEHALWKEEQWGKFVHPEYRHLEEATAARSRKSISLNDCLEEFTKEEELGEEDLWYCPQCKKHQQATKKFDLWTIPDVLVVHLKRFSNSRMLRDKIDAFVDFPIEGLDLETFSGEREVAKRLSHEGHDISTLGLSDIDEPLLYDLFAVDEHLGGLGGGHYRAYAKNHETDKWYHFDDSHVSLAEATDSVNANAYLLFYKRRTNRPIGGKTFEKVQAANQKLAKANNNVESEVQLPTPPDDEETSRMMTHITNLPLLSNSEEPRRWVSLASSPSLSVDDDENAIEIESDLELESAPFEDSQYDEFDDQSDPLARATRSYNFPNPTSMMASPASSNAAELGDADTPEMDFADLDDNATRDEPENRDLYLHDIDDM